MTAPANPIDESSPLARLTTAGLGFVVEHVAFLQIPLNSLKVDAVTAAAQTTYWRHRVAELTVLHREYGACREAAGASSDAAASIADALLRLRGFASTVNVQLGETVPLIRDTHEDLHERVEGFVDDLIAEFVAARAASAITQGVSMAISIASAVEQASALGDEMVQAIDEMLDRLDASASVIAEAAAAFQTATKPLAAS